MVRKARPGFSLCIFSSLTCLKKPVFSQPVTISKKWKNPSSAFSRKRTWVQALPRLSTCSLGLPASGRDLKSRKGLYSGPSPIRKALVNEPPFWTPRAPFCCSRAHLLFPLLRPLPATFNARSLSREGNSPLSRCLQRSLIDCVHWEGEFSLFRLFRVFLLFLFFFFCCCCVKWNDHFVSLLLVSFVCFAAWNLVEHCTYSSLLRPDWSSSSSSAANFLSGSSCSFAIRCGKRSFCS